MGTEVHSNMQLPGYHTLRNPESNSGNVVWPLHHENQNSRVYDDLVLTKLAMGYDQEQMRQTILKHDSIFRHQLHELHRLYRIQTDMMSEIKSKEGNKYLIPVTTSWSNPFSFGFTSKDAQKRWHTLESHLSDLNCFTLSKSSANSIQSQFSPLEGNVLHSGCCRLFDLELPAEGYINNEEASGGLSAVSGLESYLLKGRCEVLHERDGNSSMHCDSKCSCNSEPNNFGLNLKRTHGFTNLNKPIWVEEAFTSACVGISGYITCLKEEVQRKDISSSANFCQEPYKARDKGISLNNLHSEVERRRNGWLSSKFENGQTGSNESFHLEDLQTPCKSVEVETTKAHSAMCRLSDRNMRETSRKQKIFGIGIHEKSNGMSPVAPYAFDPLPVHFRSVSANSEIPSCSTRTKISSSLSQNLLGNPGSRTYGQLNSSSTALMEGHGIIRGKLLVDSNSILLPSFRTEVSPQNDFQFGCPCHSVESHGYCPSVGLSTTQNGIESKFASEHPAQRVPKLSYKILPGMMEAKSAVDLNTRAMALDSYQSEEIFRSNFVSVNGSTQQNSNGGLSWLRAKTACNAKPIKEVEGSHQVNLDSLQNCSQQSSDNAMRIQDSVSPTCVNDAKCRKSDCSCSSSSTKLLGFSISESVCKDLPPPKSPSKPDPTASANCGVNFVSIHGPPPPNCGEQCLVEGLVAEKRLVNQNADVGHIDLNLCVIEEGIEEDVQPTSINVRIAEKDLEMPVTIEIETRATSGCESLESNVMKPSNSLQDEIHESQGLLNVSMAAEALVALSSSHVINLQQSAGFEQSGIAASDSLHRFAEIVTSCWTDTTNDVESAKGACLDSIPYRIDYFEFITLNLKETKVDDCYYKLRVQDNKKGEDKLPRWPQRGQARRGRQRKDFQRDILPSLTSLSRNEVTEDFQMIEGLIQAAGGNWQSTQKNNAKGSTCRGRKHGGGSAVPPTMTEDCSNQFQQMKRGIEEETNLRGWGKRTRRLPRQRCLVSNPPLAIK